MSLFIPTLGTPRRERAFPINPVILIRFRFFAADAHRRTQTDIRKRNTAFMQKICRKKPKLDHYISKLTTYIFRFEQYEIYFF